MADPWRIRPVEPTDADAIAAAERVCFSDPWTLGGVVELLQSETTVGLVAVADGSKNRLAGYVFGRAIADEGEILNLAVLPDARRQGLGRRLLAASLERLQAKGIETVFLEVRESNRSARELYRSAGFAAVAVRADYYRKPREDAVVLRLDLGPAGK